MATFAIAPSYATIGSLILTGQEDSGVQFLLEDVQGWGAPQGTLTPVQKPRQPGAWAGSSYAKPRPMVLKGTTWAPTAALASDALDRLINAFSLDDSVLTVVESGRARWVTVRRDGDVIPVSMGATAFSWSVQVVALDPRKFGATLTGSTFLPSSTGGKQWADQWAETWPAVTNAGTVSLTNPGNEVGPVVLRIDGPATGPQITHVGSGAALTFSSSLVLGTGEWLTVDMEKRTAMANDQSSRNGYITSRGWSGFDPGINVWSLSAAGYNVATKLTVTGTVAFK
jgi:hypothetical protein